MSEADVKQDQLEQEELEEVVTEQEEALAREEQQTDQDLILELQGKIAELTQQTEENMQKYLRAQADFDNFRKRMRKEKEDQLKYAALPVMEQLLPVLDNFERALATKSDSEEAKALAEGIEMVYRQMMQVLQTEGLEVIPAVGQPFDPYIHQAVMQVESEEHESGVVIEELQKGYQLKDKVIRPSMVKVNS